MIGFLNMSANEKPIKVQIKDKDGKVKTIGHYFEKKNVFKCKRKKSIHYYRKANGWGLDSSLLNTLIDKKAKIILSDEENGWEYQTEALNYKLYGSTIEQIDYREQKVLPIDKWTVTKAPTKTNVLHCSATRCIHNFSNFCVNGVIKLSEDGGCLNFEY